MKKYLISLVCIFLICAAGCGFLTPVTKTDTQGNQTVVAKGSQYLEAAQGVLNSVSGFPMFEYIASGISGLLGIAVTISNNMARKRSNALVATIQGVGVFTDNYDLTKDNISKILIGANQQELAKTISDVFDKNQSLKVIIQKIANSRGIESFLNSFVQKFNPNI